MQVQKIIKYMAGTVSITVEGYYIERFINICIKEGILLENIVKNKSTYFVADVNVSKFKKLRKICKTTKCKLKINSKKGFPFFLHKHKKRRFFILSLAIIMLSIISLSNFVWNIEIIGDNDIDKNEVLEIVKESGLDIGKYKGNININDIINQIRLLRDDISWVGIDIDGTNAKITIKEAELKPEIIDKEDYCNIVAEKPSMILKINALTGTSVVQEGDVVPVGGVLIGGYMEGLYTDIRYVHAQGEILAKVWYSNKQKIYLNNVIEVETGNIEEKYSIFLKKNEINLSKGVSKFEIYDTIQVTEKIKLFSNFYLPIEIVKNTNIELKKSQIIYTVEEAKQLGIQQAKEELLQEIENVDNIIDVQINVYQDIQFVEVEVIYEVEEYIGIEEKIVL